MSSSVAVVGSGVAGLTVTKELRRRGYAVTLFEREPQVAVTA